MTTRSPASDLARPKIPSPSYAPDNARGWALVDVETSGLIARRDRVLSVAVVTIGPDGEQTDEFSTLLDPGCDPGPVEVHGLTSEVLAGAPMFPEVAERLGAMLRDRVFVAHNAQFDYDFLAHEFARARLFLPVAQRLCTLALNRQLDPPTEDMRLGTLAAHYGVPQAKAHDALDDTRVLAGIFRATLREAARLDLPLPLVACPPRQDVQFAPSPPKTPCAYRNPGRLERGEPLVQGMKVAVTGATSTARAELVARAVGAGLNVMSTVSRHTSVLVTNDLASGSAKARRAVDEGVPVVDEREFLGLLEDVRDGVPHAAPKTQGSPVGRREGVPTAVGVGGSTSADPDSAFAASVPCALSPASSAAAAPVASVDAAASTVSADASSVAVGAVAGVASIATSDSSSPTSHASRKPGVSGSSVPLAGRRILVLGGIHAEAAAARGRVVALGGSAAVNLSRSVTDVVVLPGGEEDRRMRRITDLGIAVHDEDWLSDPTASTIPNLDLSSAPTAEVPTAQVPTAEGPTASAGLRDTVPLPSTGAADAVGVGARGAVPQVLPRGGVVDLPAPPSGTPPVPWHITATWAPQGRCEIDVVAFVLDEDGQVMFDEDFVFYGAPENPGGTVRLLTDGPAEQSIALDLASLPPASRRVVVAAAIDGDVTFGEVGAVQVAAAPGAGAAVLARATLDAATTERTLLLAEVYRRGPVWRFRAVGQGYEDSLATLARGYGVDVAD
ncbi:TerD family protein [Streptomyces sp. NPDC001941]|uniref:TerD family protein n=1 Tax=Streptomyces sp. NPDC001941 TaxID=3154659 RepID=UPI00332157D6